MKILCLFLFLFTGISNLSAQPDTIRVNDNRLQMRALKLASRRYLVYRQRDEQAAKKQISVWQRDVALKNGLVQISQKWYGGDTVTRQLYSVCEAQNFRPVYHFAKNFRNEIEAYTFRGNQTLGADSIAENKRHGFVNTWQAPSFNWELDMETFALLPLKKGKKFVIPFYHPGSSTGPGYYVYEVTGEEKIGEPGEKKKACWLLKINYSDQNYAIFWIDKKQKEVLKMEEFFNGWYRFKIKLSA